ncbi:unnamed protein product [Rotaria magnacalcarata]|nr:unnamed protein product [Rotaria magnacalcarata]
MESKGIKAHFELDDSSLLVLTRIEFVFERKDNDTDKNNTIATDEQSTLSKIRSKISSFFKSKIVDDGTKKGDEVEQNKETKTTSDEPSTKPVDNNGTTNTTNDTSTTTTAPTPTTPRQMSAREPLKFKIVLLDYPDPSEEAQTESRQK